MCRHSSCSASLVCSLATAVVSPASGVTACPSSRVPLGGTALRTACGQRRVQGLALGATSAPPATTSLLIWSPARSRRLSTYVLLATCVYWCTSACVCVCVCVCTLLYLSRGARTLGGAGRICVVECSSCHPRCVLFLLSNLVVCQTCGAPSLYCPEGSHVPTPVSLGYYAIGNDFDLSNNTRVAQQVCPIGHFCVDGLLLQCPGSLGSFRDCYQDANSTATVTATTTAAASATAVELVVVDTAATIEPCFFCFLLVSCPL